jgi:hypothetical protein
MAGGVKRASGGFHVVRREACAWSSRDYARKAMTLRGPTLVQDFQAVVRGYIERRFGAAGRMRRNSSLGLAGRPRCAGCLCLALSDLVYWHYGQGT